MLIIAFKLLITPLMIVGATLAGRRWGSAASGILIGLPLTSGPISFILACQHGDDFAAQAAIGGIAGQISICCFCLAYARAAQRFDWPASVCLGVAAFLLSTWTLNGWALQLMPAFLALLCAVVCAIRLMPQRRHDAGVTAPPRWDLPARVFAATAFVVALTTLSDALGPQLSGLFSPFPIFGIVFAAFTQAQQGPGAASNLLRAMVGSSVGYASFFLVVGAFLTRLGIAPTYFFAALSGVSASAVGYFMTRRLRRV